MMIFWKAGLAFLAVPKTGTQAYEAALRPFCDISYRNPPGLKHMNAQYFCRRMEPLFQDRRDKPLELLAVVREPISWLGSWFRYRARPALQGHANSTAGLSFDQFVEGYLQEERPQWAAIGAQARFVSNPDGDVLVDHLFAYENQDALRGFLTDRLGRTLPDIARQNSSPPADLHLSRDIEDELRRRNAADFTLHAAIVGGHTPTRLV